MKNYGSYPTETIMNVTLDTIKNAIQKHLNPSNNSIMINPSYTATKEDFINMKNIRKMIAGDDIEDGHQELLKFIMRIDGLGDFVKARNEVNSNAQLRQSA